MNNLVNSALNVCEKSIEAIELLKNLIGTKDFLNAVELIYDTKGRVIVSGMGKSGIIAKKIAATLSSTGTPSFFIHPGEASHGDLGMITKDDTVIMLSFSGETKELRDLILYIKRYHIKSICITGSANSVLAKNVTVPLILPKIEEAVDFNAPTTSTTMMVVLGDAIAVSLIHYRGFNVDDYKILHPGGRLGASFVKVKDLTLQQNDLPFCNENDKIEKIAAIITEKKLGIAIVVDQNQKLMGVITDGDMRRAIVNISKDICASDIMTKNPRTILNEKLAIEALDIMNMLRITSLIVIDEKNSPLGLVRLHDCLEAGLNSMGS